MKTALRYTLLVVFSLLILSSCRSVAVYVLTRPIIFRTVFGVSKPKFISRKEVVKFAQKRRIDTTEILYLKKLTDFIMDGSIKIYYRDGNMIKVDHGACLNVYPESVATDSTLGFINAKKDSTENISELNKHLYFPNRQATNLQDTAARYDITFLVPIETWGKGPTKVNLKRVMALKEGLKTKKVKILYVDLDLLYSMVPPDSVDYYKKQPINVNYTEE